MKSIYLIFAFFALPFLCLSHNESSRIGFIENQNQFHENVRFQAHFNQYTVFLEDNRFTFLLESAEDRMLLHDIIKEPAEAQADFFVRGHAYRVNFAGANPMVETEKELPHGFTLNYFLGADPQKWASGVRSYKKVKYLDLYDGIDLLAVVDKGNLKYDFIVEPNADPNEINLEFEGLQEIKIIDGDLVLVTSLGEVKELEPFAYQKSALGIEKVKCTYHLEGQKVTFVFPEGYDTSRELIIDPVVIASTLSGTPGFSSNYGHGATFDLAGNIYTHAIAFGTEYPVTTGAIQMAFGGGGTDIAISKYNPTGTDLLYATYIGGDGGDYPHSTITTQFEELFVYGTTNSSNYPTSSNAYSSELNSTGGGDPWGGFSQDIVITKISADGTVLMGSTYVGGSDVDGLNSANAINYGDNYRGEINLDPLGFPYVVSQTVSSDFPTTSGAYQETHQGIQDAVVFKMNQDLSNILWSTYFGSSGDDTGYGIRISETGDVYICGSTEGTDLPVTDNAFQNENAGSPNVLDGFISKLSSDGSQLLQGTYVGTSAVDQAFFIDIDNDNDVWIYGQSEGDWPVVGDGYSTPNGSLFISKFNAELDEMLLSSRVGPGTSTWGSDAAPVAFLVDRCDRIYICGYNAQSGFELTDDALYTTGSFILSAWEEDMSELAFASYYGGSHVDGGTSRFDKSGIVYQGVCNGGFFPTNPDAWATDQTVGWDIGVFKIDFELSGVNAAITTNDDISGCAPHEIQFNNYSVGNIFIWDFGDGSPESNEFEPVHTYTEPGEYTISLISYDSLSCNLADTAYLYIEIGSPETFTPDFSYEVDCATQTVTLTNETGASFLDYQWDMGDGTIYNEENAVHTFEEPGVYNVVLTATDNACDNTQTLEAEIEIFGALVAEIENEQVIACDEVEVEFNNLSNGQNYYWDFGDGTTSDEENPTHVFTGPGIFEVSLIAYHDQTCNASDTTTVIVAVGAEQEVDAEFNIFQTDCESFIVQTNNESIGDFLSFVWDMGDGTVYNDEDVEHQYSGTGTYTVTLSIEDTLCFYTNDATVTINVNNEATANALLENSEGCPPLEVDFNNLSTGEVFFWDFGDGNTSTEYEPDHIYTEPGEYEVMLIVNGSESCPGQDTTFASVTVLDNSVEPLFTFTQSGLCADYTADFQNLSDGNDLQLTWDFNGTQVMNVETPTHVFPGAGTYSVSLTVTEPVCLNSATYAQEITLVSGFSVHLGEDRDICHYESSQVLDTGIDPDGMSFTWSTGETGVPSIEVNQPGIYSVEVTDGTCTDVSEVSIGQGTVFQSAYALEICEGISHQITIPAYGQSYEWQTGQTTQTISITRAGNYGYSFVDMGGCIQSDTVYVSAILPEASLFVPNTFTPNGDGINELFKVVGEEIEQFNIKIFNRWGQMLYESDDYLEGWNGSLHNDSKHYVPDGVYPYIINLKSTCRSERIERTGTVTIFR